MGIPMTWPQNLRYIFVLYLCPFTFVPLGNVQSWSPRFWLFLWCRNTSPWYALLVLYYSLYHLFPTIMHSCCLDIAPMGPCHNPVPPWSNKPIGCTPGYSLLQWALLWLNSLLLSFVFMITQGHALPETHPCPCMSLTAMMDSVSCIHPPSR